MTFSGRRLGLLLKYCLKEASLCGKNIIFVSEIEKGEYMENPLLEKLETYYIRFKEIGQLITDPEVIGDMELSLIHISEPTRP